jgi:Protein of function (DUF2518)
MPSPIQFAQLAQGMSIFVLACTLVTALAFMKQWGWRFRLVGITSFSVVLVVGLFGLSLAPVTHGNIVGARPFTVVYDRLGPQAVITVKTDITATELAATLRQSAINLFSPGRNSQGTTNQLTIRARTLVHPNQNVSQPIYLGQIKRSLRLRDDPDMQLELYPEALARAAEISKSLAASQGQS